MKKLFSNKIVFIILVALFLLLLTNSNCFAVSKEFEFSDGSVFTVPNYNESLTDYMTYINDGSYYILAWNSSAGQLVSIKNNSYYDYLVLDSTLTNINGVYFYSFYKGDPSDFTSNERYFLY